MPSCYTPFFISVCCCTNKMDVPRNSNKILIKRKLKNVYQKVLTKLHNMTLHRNKIYL